LEVDLSGNLYVCGAQHNGNNYDYFVAKYTAAGILIWQQSYNGTGNGDDIPASIKLDNSNNVIVTGTSTGQSSMTDYTTLKFNGINGNIIWSKRLNLQKVQIATGMAITNTGDVVITGSTFTNFVNADILTVKYSGITGAQLFIDYQGSNGNGHDLPSAIKIGNNGNIFVVGTSNSNQSNRDIKVVAYSNNLQKIWDKYIDKNGNSDEGYGLEIDSNNDPIITGYCSNNVGGSNLYIGKYSGNSGNVIWERERASLDYLGSSKGRDIKLKDSNIYVCGEEDKDGVKNFVTLCLDLNGVPKWSRHHSELGNDSRASHIKVKEDEIVVTGNSIITGGKQITSVKYSTKERPDSVEYVNGKPSHIDGVILIRFAETKLNIDAINKLELEAGDLENFVDSAFIQEMSNKITICKIEINYSFKHS